MYHISTYQKLRTVTGALSHLLRTNVTIPKDMFARSCKKYLSVLLAITICWIGGCAVKMPRPGPFSETGECEVQPSKPGTEYEKYFPLLKGLCFINLGKYREALRVLSLSPEDVEPLDDYLVFFYAWALYGSGASRDAVSLLEWAEKKYSASPLSPLFRAFRIVVEGESGKRGTSAKVLSQILPEIPSSVLKHYVMYHQIIFSSREGIDEKLKETIDDFLALVPSPPYVLSLYSLNLLGAHELLSWMERAFNSGRYSYVTSVFPHVKDRALKFSAFPEAWMMAAVSYFFTGRYNESEAILKRFISYGEEEYSAQSLFYLARIYYRTGRKDKVIPAFKKIIRQYPGSSWAPRAAYKIMELVDLREKLKYLDIIIKNYPQSDLSAKAAFLRGLYSHMLGDDEKAVEYLQLAASLEGLTPRVKRSTSYWKLRLSPEVKTEDVISFAASSPPDHYTVLAAAVLLSHDVEFAGVEGGEESVRMIRLISPFEKETRRIRILFDLGLKGFASYEMNFYASRFSSKEEGFAFLESLVKTGLPHFSIRWFGRFHSYPSSSTDIVRDEVYKLLFPRAFDREVRRLCVERHGLDANLVYALIHQESHFMKQAVSVAGARGLMQLMPFTASRVADILELGPVSGEILFKPEVNINLGCQYLKILLDSFDGNVPLALAAYNAGPRNVRRWLEELAPRQIDEFIDTIPYPETRRYVQLVLAKWFSYTALYGGILPARALLLNSHTGGM